MPTKEMELYQEWLNNLKVGDEVCIQTNSYYHPYEIATILHITLTRMFDVGRYRYNSDGRQRGNYYARKMIQVTDEIKEKIARDNALDFIACMKWSELSTQQLLDVLKIVNDTTK